MPAAHRITLDQARTHWHRKQGLAAPVSGSLSDIVQATGWVRTLGGADVYLSTRARVPGMAREQLDAAAEAMDLRVLPAIRGCIYLVPKVHAALVLRFAESIWRSRAERDIEKVGAKWKVVDDTAAALRSVMRSEGHTTDALRKALPSGSIPSFGEIGKKVGLTSPLPLALRQLEFAGEIDRTLDGGRLDTERYLWRKAKRSVFTGAKLPSDIVGLTTELARIFFAQMGPATLKHFTEWASVTQRDAKAAIASLPLVPVEVDGYAKDALVLETDVEELTAKVKPSDRVSLVSFEDNLLTVHGGPGVLTPEAEHARPVPVWGQTRGTTLGDARHIHFRSIVVGDQLAGFWEFDPSEGEIVLGFFTPPSKAVQKAAEEQAADLAQFLRDDIGHALSFSLDTEEAVQARADAVRSMNAPAKKRARG